VNTPLSRIISFFENNGIWGKRGLYADIARNTGFTPAYVGQVFSGKKEPADKFILAVCNAFSIDFDEVETGVKSTMLGGTRDGGYYGSIREETPRISRRSVPSHIDNILGMLEVHFPGIKAGLKDQAVMQGLKELLKMPEPQRWEAVGMLKRMNEKIPVLDE